MKQKNIKTT